MSVPTEKGQLAEALSKPPLPDGTKQRDGGTAFPDGFHHPGMSLRDWFAGKAMIAFVSDPTWQALTAAKRSTFDQERMAEIRAALAADAYAIADAMLKERKR